MKTAIIIVSITFFLIFGVPFWIKKALARRENRGKAIKNALAMIDEAGLTAHSKAQEEARRLAMDNAVATLKKAGYTITPK